MAENQIERLNYYQGQYLRARDFSDQQEYHRGLRRRHNLGPHTWGIITGLELVEQDKEGGSGKDVFIQPGMAVDGYGREVLVFSAHKLDTADFIRFTRDDHYEVWIAVQEEPVNRVEAGYANCDDQPNRIRESYRVFIEPLAPQPSSVVVDGRAAFPPVDDDDPSRIPPDLAVPYQELPLDFRQRWMLRLGSVRWDGSAFQEAAEGKLQEGREYAGTVTARLYAPQGGLVIQDRFTAPLEDADPGVALSVEGSLTVERDITARADLHIDGGMLDFRLPDGAGGGLFALRRVETSQGDDLRVRIGEDTAGDNRLLVGPQTGGTDDTFVPVLSVVDNNTVGVRAERPEHALQVGDGRAAVSLGVRGPDADPAAAVIALEDADASRWFKLGYDTATDFLKISSDALDPIVVFERSGGLVGIGTGSPQARLHIMGGRDVDLSDTAGFLVMGNVNGLNIAMDDNEIQARNNGAANILHFQAEGGELRVHRWRSELEQFVVTDTGSVGVGTSTPDSKLQVMGSIRLGSSGSLFAPGSPQSLRILIGDVSPDGVLLGGTGFSAARLAQGHYRVSFTSAFPGTPVVLASLVDAPNMDNVITTSAVSGVQFEVFIRDIKDIDETSGVETNITTPQDCRFTFIALGQA